MKIVINKCFGGFGISPAGMMCYAKHKGITLYPEQDNTYLSITVYYTAPPDQRLPVLDSKEFLTAPMPVRAQSNENAKRNSIYAGDIPRDDPALVAAVEELGDAANGDHAELRVVEIPDGTAWQIEDYDGMESIAESHRTWG